MDDKQNEHFSENDSQNQQFEIEVTIKPSVTNTNTQQVDQQKETLNNRSHSYMAGNLQMNQNVSQVNNTYNSNQNQNISSSILQSSQNMSVHKEDPKNASKNDPNQFLFNPAVTFLLKALREANTKGVQSTAQTNPLQQVMNVLNQKASALQQSANKSQQNANMVRPPANNISQQPPINTLRQQTSTTASIDLPKISPTPTQPSFPPPIQTSNITDSKSRIKIEGYRINQENHIEYKYSPVQNGPQATAIPMPSYIDPTQIHDFEAIRQFWLENNGYNEKEPRRPISKPKKKKKRRVSSYLDYSSNSPTNSPPPNKDSPKNVARKSGSKISLSNLPPLLSIDKEPKVNILGIVQKSPIIKIAIQTEGSQNIKVVPATEARKTFPIQLSKFYEKFITFIDYE